MSKITISGHEYGVEGATLIAERYDDDTELWLSPVHSTGAHESLHASFVHRGPRGGISAVTVHVGNGSDVARWVDRLWQAGHHLRMVRSWKGPESEPKREDFKGGST